MSSLKEYSRENWSAQGIIGTHLEQVTAGALQRTADATELMAQNYERLIRDRDSYKIQNEILNKSSDRLVRRINALRGVITWQKKQLTKLKLSNQAL